LIEYTRVAVLGAGGFIGRAAVSAVTQSGEPRSVRSMVRRGSDRPLTPGDVHYGDVRDVSSIRAAIRGTGAVIHAATYVGYDPDLCRDTNITGTQNVVDACAAEGIERLVYVSTASVYGAGPHRNTAEHELKIRPESALSRSRADAETIVLSAGGSALRPDMVFGAGDKWFVPSLLRFTESIGGLVDNGETLMSVVHVDDLGSVASRLALAERFAAGAFNVSYDQPTTVCEIVEQIGISTEPDLSLSPVTRSDAKALASARGFTERQLALLTTDHWFSSEKLRSALGNSNWGEFGVNDADRDWYREHLMNPAV